MTRLGTLNPAMRSFSARMSASGAGSLPGARGDDGDDGLAEVRVRHADDGGFAHARQLVEETLHLGPGRR